MLPYLETWYYKFFSKLPYVHCIFGEKKLNGSLSSRVGKEPIWND